MTSTATDPGTSGAPHAPAEAHIAGILIQVRPDHVAQVCAAVSLLPHAEVTHQSADGRVVAVLEAPTGRRIAEQTESIKFLAGVINVALVYQHAEAEEELVKEIPE